MRRKIFFVNFNLYLLRHCPGQLKKVALCSVSVDEEEEEENKGIHLSAHQRTILLLEPRQTEL